ncbi:MAG: hypothetical protein LBT20_07035 [Clostridiales bacterium]|jgi:hypothetical protein|nr:hypothetical protein [Clostridiales bacterium]
MIKISTAYNDYDKASLRPEKKRILIGGAACAAVGAVGGILGAVLIHPIFWILLIGAAIIFGTAYYFSTTLDKLPKKRAESPYYILSFSEKTMTAETYLPRVLTPPETRDYPIENLLVKTSSDGQTFYLYAFDSVDQKRRFDPSKKENADVFPKTFLFNTHGFLEGTKEEFIKYITHN